METKSLTSPFLQQKHGWFKDISVELRIKEMAMNAWWSTYTLASQLLCPTISYTVPEPRGLFTCAAGEIKVNINTAGLCRTQHQVGCCYLFHRALEEAVEQRTCRGHKAPTTL